MKRGRPRKIRPTSLEELRPGASILDIAAATGTRRRFIEQWLAIGSIPDEEFERLIESVDPPTVHELELLARSRAGKKTEYERRCPHCGGLLRIESAS